MVVDDEFATKVKISVCQRLFFTVLVEVKVWLAAPIVAVARMLS